jgi:hypothetical protein
VDELLHESTLEVLHWLRAQAHSTQKVDETKVALRELGLNDELDGE